MKLAVVTHADSKVKEMSDLTHPYIIDYASRCNAHYLNLDHECNVPHAYRILKFFDLLDEYDRILNLDSDILINKNCPNIFEEVPADNIGTVFEDVGTRTKDRRDRIRLSQQKFGDIGWNCNYINSGVFVVSKIHKCIFQPIDGQLWTSLGYDDVLLGYQIKKNNFDIHQLDYRWNHMTMFSEKFNNCADRFKSYIIHYAGQGLFDKPNRILQIKSDIMRIYGK